MEMLLEGQDRPLAIAAPGKINLALHVVGRRERRLSPARKPDGLHAFRRPPHGRSVPRRTRSRRPARSPSDVPLDDANLVIAARDRLRAAFPLADCPPVSIDLEKNMPVASGLGGGSSDAAATLVALASVWELTTTEAGSGPPRPALGADVPMCLAAQPLIASGIGERIAIVPDFPELQPGAGQSRRAGADGCRVPGARIVRKSRPAAPARSAFVRPPRRLARPHPQRPRADRAVDRARDRRCACASSTWPERASPACRDRARPASACSRTTPQAKGAARHIGRERPGWFVVATQSAGAEGNGAS